jgi:hypothetical protein
VDRYAKVRTVSRHQIAVEMGWSQGKTKRRLWGLRWLTQPFRVGPNLYNADLIEALRALYRWEEPSTREDRDFLARYLKEITDERRPDRQAPGEGSAQYPAAG